MSEKTGISWTDHTFNPWWGCQKVSPACDHCYAERDAKRFAPGRVLWGVGSERRTFEDKHWRAPMLWAKAMPAKLGRRPRVFCASMADWLDLDAPISEFVRLLDTIRATPELDWQLLSKRIGNWQKRVAEAQARVIETEGGDSVLAHWIERWLAGEGPMNVWLGATVIDQAEADRDVPKLLATPARVRFLSIEPMLGPINLGAHLWQCCGQLAPGTNHGLLGQEPDHCCGNPDTRDELHWVIAGGESGPHARPAHPDWFRSLRAQCQAAGVPFHFKQWGEWAPTWTEAHEHRGLAWQMENHDPAGCEAIAGTRVVVGKYRDGRVVEALWPVVKVGKAAAGRLLDGVEHNGFPS